MWMGESGENEDAWIDSFRVLLETNNIGWCFWPYKKMDSDRGMVKFDKTKEWDEIIKYAELPKKILKKQEMQNLIEKWLKSFSDLLENIKFKNCEINFSYLKALGVK